MIHSFSLRTLSLGVLFYFSFQLSPVFAVPEYQYDFRRHKETNYNSQMKKKMNRFYSSHKTSRRKRFVFPSSVVPKKTMVIIAPHPDDEILCCSDTIRTAIKNNKSVKIIVVTNGDAFDEDNPIVSHNYGHRRLSESLSAAKKLGLKKKDVFFLGFPDQGLRYFSQKTPFLSPFTNQNRTSAHSAFPNTLYMNQGLDNSINSLLSRWNVDEIFIPSQQDTHPDHKTLGIFMEKILKTKEANTKVFSYLVHSDTTQTEKIRVSNKKKLFLISLFASQFWTPNHKKFLESFSFFPETFTLLVEGTLNK